MIKVIKMKHLLFGLILLTACFCCGACYSEYSMYYSSPCSELPSCGHTEFKNETVGATETPNEGHQTVPSESENTIGNFDDEQTMPDNYQDPPHCSEDTNEVIETKPIVPSDQQNPLENENMCNQCKFVVNNQIIPYANNTYFCDERDYVFVPFVTVIKMLGAQVTWIANNIAEIIVNGEEYVLDVNDATLIKKGTNLNCIIPAPGSSIHYQNSGPDFMIDHITFRTIMMLMNLNVKVDVNWDDHIVKILQQS